MPRDLENNPHQLRVIKTARTESAINEATYRGFRPLVKKVEASPEIWSKFAIWQNKKSGEIEVSGDFRSNYSDEEWDQVIDWSYYYPEPFANPFEAYLVPEDLDVGERVFLEDLIERRLDCTFLYHLRISESDYRGTVI